MKRLIYLIAVTALLAIFVACDKNNELLENTISLKEDVNSQKISMENAQELLAGNLLQTLKKDDGLIESLTELSNKTFDMDYDVLGVPFLKNMNEPNTRISYPAFVDKDLLELIEKEYPLLNFYIPFVAEDFKNAENYYVVLWPEFENNGDEYKVKAFDKKGNSIILSSLEEPSIPYIVIGYNERVQLIDNASDLRSATSSNQFMPLYKTERYSYILPEQFNPKNYAESTNNHDNIKTRSVRYRDPSAYGMSEMIKSARFSSIDAIDRVEGWGKGQPEVAAKVAFYKVSDPTLEKRIIDLLKSVTNEEEKILKALDSYSKDLIHGEASINMDNHNWFKGSRWFKREIKTNYGNWRAFRWNEQGLPSMCKYKFYEMDGKCPVEPSISFKGVTITFKINEGTQDIGEGTVFYQDPLNTEYSVSGDNFHFFIDQEQKY